MSSIGGVGGSYSKSAANADASTVNNANACASSTRIYFKQNLENKKMTGSMDVLENGERMGEKRASERLVSRAEMRRSSFSLTG